MRTRIPTSGAGRDAASGSPRPGYVLIAVLIVVVVLSLTAYQFTDLMSAEYRSAVRTNDVTQAKLSAVSGIHYAAALLADRDSFNTTLNGNPFDNETAFGQTEVRSNPSSPRQAAYFAIVYAANTGSGSSGFETKYGVLDEAGRLNINALIQIDPTGQALRDALMKLPNMTEEVADAIVDWVDADDDSRPSGAESDYYTSLGNSYKAKNGPLNSLDELLLVKGVTPELLYGNDRNRNGIADDAPSGSQEFSRGWSEFLTVYGRELNVDSLGQARVYLDQDDMPTLYSQLQQAVGADLATYIVAYKTFQTVGAVPAMPATTTPTTTPTTGGGTTGTGTTTAQPQPATTEQAAAILQPMLDGGTATSKRKIGTAKNNFSLLSLIGTQVTLPPQPTTDGTTPPTYVLACPLNDPNKLAELLPVLLDKTTSKADIELIPRLNVNTATREVLLTLTGITGTSGSPLLSETDVDNIINARLNLTSTDPGTSTAAWLITGAKLSATQFQALEKYVTGRTMVYRAQSIGYFGKGGPVARVEAVIDTNQGAPRILYFRDLSDLDNPRGFEPPRRE